MLDVRRHDRGSLATLGALAGVAAVSWLALLARGDEMEMAAAPFLAAWTLMMAAMMLPSVAPLVLVVRRARRSPTWPLAGGYLTVWAVTGLVAYAASRATDLMMVPPLAAAAVLAAAGVYQLTPLKHACLRRCRAPLDFLVQRWRPGRRGAFRLGVEHGGYCVGCCVGLMAVLVGAAAMGLAWAALIAAVVFAEKALPWGEATARAAGVLLIGSAIAVAVAA